MKKILKKEQGITLVALVTTVIILLILSGITIGSLTNKKGLINEANQNSQSAQKETLIQKIEADLYSEKTITGKTPTKEKLIEIARKYGTVEDEKLKIQDSDYEISFNEIEGWTVRYISEAKLIQREFQKNTSLEDSMGNIVTVPKGFKVSSDSADDVTEGVVIEDANENQWVWIPVSSRDLSLMYTEEANGWKMQGTENVYTKYKTITTSFGSTSIDRTSPGNNDYREPDIVSRSSFDNNEDNRRSAGFIDNDGITVSSFETMAIELRDDYSKMIKSLKIYMGFYIGRYELGIDNNNVQIKKGTVYNNIDWYQAYKECKVFSNNEVSSRMIYGCQWDQVCRFVQGTGENSSIDDSRAYGNYANSTVSTDINGTGKFNNTTGRSENWKIKNIYDLAGNCREWTQEVNQDGKTYRGGYCGSDGTESPIYKRVYSLPTTANDWYSTRPILYIK